MRLQYWIFQFSSIKLSLFFVLVSCMLHWFIFFSVLLYIFRSFSQIKAIAKRNENLFDIASKSRAKTIEREIKKSTNIRINQFLLLFLTWASPLWLWLFLLKIFFVILIFYRYMPLLIIYPDEGGILPPKRWKILNKIYMQKLLFCSVRIERSWVYIWYIGNEAD